MIAAMELDTILDRLGGSDAVAKSLRCGQSAISNWKARGIPPGRKFDLLAMAERMEVALSIAEIEAANASISAKATEAA